MKLKTNNTFYVSVEGESELRYLKKLKQLINDGDYAYKVEFIAKKDSPLSFAKSKNNGFIEFPFYHICDYEGNSLAEIKKFTSIMDDIKDARKVVKVEYNLAYSNLCFELWLILYKVKFSKKLTNKEDYLNEINKIYDLNCSSWENLKAAHNMDKIMNQITIDDILRAIKNAKEIQKYNFNTYKIIEYKKSKYYKENPSLNINEFVEFVFNVCKI